MAVWRNNLKSWIVKSKTIYLRRTKKIRCAENMCTPVRPTNIRNSTARELVMRTREICVRARLEKWKASALLKANVRTIVHLVSPAFLCLYFECQLFVFDIVSDASIKRKWISDKHASKFFMRITRNHDLSHDLYCFWLDKLIAPSLIILKRKTDSHKHLYFLT